MIDKIFMVCQGILIVLIIGNICHDVLVLFFRTWSIMANRDHDHLEGFTPFKYMFLIGLLVAAFYIPHLIK